MPTVQLISVGEYLKSSYEPDCDYIEGRIEERNLGEKEHGWLQILLATHFMAQRRSLGLWVYAETRTQVLPRRFRIPDLCVYVGPEPEGPILRTPAYLCIEILSTEDRLSRIQERVDDYLRFGVPYVWVVDPRTRRGWIHTKDGCEERENGVLSTGNPGISVDLKSLD